MHALAKDFRPHVWVNAHSGMEALFMPYDHRWAHPRVCFQQPAPCRRCEYRLLLPRVLSSDQLRCRWTEQARRAHGISGGNCKQPLGAMPRLC